MDAVDILVSASLGWNLILTAFCFGHWINLDKKETEVKLNTKSVCRNMENIRLILNYFKLDIVESKRIEKKKGAS
jgi:hypothetical protein